MKKISIACIGCGSRGRTYLSLAAKMTDHYEIIAGAEPVEARLEHVRKISNNPNFQGFRNDQEILAQPKLADLMIVSTQDSMHASSCLAALKKGYDILVEKPIATNLEDVLAIEQCAKENGRRVLVCHVLRYTPFYKKVKEIVDSGALGDIVSIHMSEGVNAFHQTHSYVRGHWGVKEKSSPMLIAKSCHDLDIIVWLLDSQCTKVSSFGDLSYFNEEHKPADAPPRCSDECPVADTCQYNANLYKTTQRTWLRHVWPTTEDVKTISDERISDWLKTSPWGRCVYQCDNNVVDHQVVNMQFANKVTASFTMTAFDDGRNMEIYGTKAVLRGGEVCLEQTGSDIIVTEHHTAKKTEMTVDPLEGGYEGHGGGDAGIIQELHKEMSKEDAQDMKSSIQVSVRSHVIGFAAEKSRVLGETINL